MWIANNKYQLADVKHVIVEGMLFLFHKYADELHIEQFWAQGSSFQFFKWIFSALVSKLHTDFKLPYY